MRAAIIGTTPIIRKSPMRLFPKSCAAYLMQSLIAFVTLPVSFAADAGYRQLFPDPPLMLRLDAPAEECGNRPSGNPKPRQPSSLCTHLAISSVKTNWLVLC